VKNTTPSRPAATWLTHIVDRIDQFAFREPDMRAIARGWQVRRDRPFTRTYRDPRWDDVAACAVCQGSGTIVAGDCPDCAGVGIRHNPSLGEVASR
jgi:hypothetical protein